MSHARPPRLSHPVPFAEARPPAFAFVLLPALAAALAACSNAAPSSRSHAGDAAPAAPMAAPEGGADAKPGGDVTTWRRSQKTPNAARLKVGDREELPLRSAQVSVRVDVK